MRLLAVEERVAMRRLVEKIEDRLFSATDSVCLDRARLVTDAYARFSGEPVPLMRARAFEHILTHMTLDLLSNPVLAGNTSSAPRAWMLVPEFGISVDEQVQIEHPGFEGFLDGKIPDDIHSFWKDRQFGGRSGIGHMSLDFDCIVNRGLEDVLARIDEHAGSGTADNRAYRNAMAISCRAVIAWADRYAQEAELAATQCTDPLGASCLHRVAAACRNVPAKPARNLFEGLQSIALVHLASVLEGQGFSMSIGLADRVLARFSDEVEKNPDEAVDLIRAFLLKIAANSLQGRGSKTQAITIGGADVAGDACNAITIAFLEAFRQTPVSDPHLFVRWHPGIDPSVWHKALEMLGSGRSMPMLVNDQQVAPGLIEANVAGQDAWDYCIVGCNELGIPGRCCQSGFSDSLGFNDLDVLDKVVRAIEDGDVRIERILDDYQEAVYRLAAHSLTTRLAHINAMAATVPFPFCSACCRSCVESGQDLLVGMPYPNIYGLFLRGTSNAVNALAAIDDLVIRNGKYSLTDLTMGVDAADKAVLGDIERAPKWGNDDDAADRLGVALNERRDRALRRVATEASVPSFTVCHVVRSLHHLDGMRIAATLDGRGSGQPVGDSIGSVIGTQRSGPTSMLGSVLKLDAAHTFGGIYNLNLTLPAGPQAHVNVIGPLAETFFQNEGQELQIGVLDASMLRRAQHDPDSYRDLVVRVAGLNARFVELSKVEQEELAVRAETTNDIET